MKKISLALKLLRRNAHAAEVRVLMIALMIAVASVTSVAFVADRVAAALTRQAGELIAADVVVISDKPTPQRYLDEANRLTLQQAEAVTFPSMVAGDAARGQGVNLAEIKAITDGFPLRGKIRITDTPGGVERDAVGVPLTGTVWVPEVLLTRIGAGMGDTLKVGGTTFTIAALITKEPDSVLDYFGIAPRVMMNKNDLAATGLIQVGSRVTYRLLMAGEVKNVASFAENFVGKTERGERIETVRDARSEVRVALERAQRLLARQQITAPAGQDAKAFVEALA